MSGTDRRYVIKGGFLGLEDKCGFHEFTFADEGFGYVTVLLGNTGDPWDYNVPPDRALTEYGLDTATWETDVEALKLAGIPDLDEIEATKESS